MKAFHINGWETDRENAETRKYVDLLWFRNKVKLMGEGLGHTLGQADKQGPFLYGMFKVIEQIAAGCKPRGWLIRNGTPMDAARMGSLMRMPPAYFEEALKFFSSAPMDWLEHVDVPSELLNGAGGQEKGGRTSGESPAEKTNGAGGQEQGGRNSASEERKSESEHTVKNDKEREALTLAAARASAPSPDEVDAWAAGAGVDPAFALEKLAEGIEREDFAKPSVRKNWPVRFLRFWKSDKEAWLKKRKKTAADFSGERQPGDQEIWWTDPLPEVQAQLQGAVLGQQKKTAARLREIIDLRKNGGAK